MLQVEILGTIICVLISFVFAAPIEVRTAISKRDIYDGQATYYETGQGACGYTDSDSDPVVAVSQSIYGGGGYCDRWMQITNTANGQSQYGKIRDECEGCGRYDIDLSSSLFQSLGADLSQGMLQVEWDFMDKDFSP